MSRYHHEEGHRSAGDSMEEIQRCLNCIRGDCVNCIGRSDPTKEVVVKPVDRSVKLKPTDIAVLRAYATSATDKEISVKVGKCASAITSSRKKLGLPPAKDLLAEERVRIAEEWLEIIK